MSFRAFRRCRVFRVAWVLAALSCDTQTSVENTIPAHQEDGVDPRSIIAIEVSNSITADDTTATDPANINVTGDFSDQPYTGTVELAKRKEVRRGMTVEDFQNRDKTGGEPPADPNTKTAPERKNTLVFLLPAGTSFKDGETIEVKVRNHITSHKTPIRGRSFSFRVGGGSAQSGELKVCTSRPDSGELAVAARARVSATFNRPVRPDGLEGAITLRGTQSGVHSGGETVTKTEGSNRISDVTRGLAEADSFLPGERVDVTYSSAILEAGSGPPGTASKLSPFLLSFQAGGGQVVQDDLAQTRIRLPLSEKATPPIAILPADFRKRVDGVEFVVVGEKGLSLFSKSGSRVWEESEAEIPLKPEDQEAFRAVDAALYDVEGKGANKVVVLLSGLKGSRLQSFEVNNSGELVASKDPSDFPAVQARKLLLADLDADGKPEILVNHPSTSFVPKEGEKQKSTGNLTIFQLLEVPPDPASINPADPSTLKPSLRFQRLDNPVPSFEPAKRIEAADLNGDGKPDLIAETESGVTLYRNAGSQEKPFNVRAVEHLEGRSPGSMLQPLAWVVLDVDGDRSQDILAWDAGGALFSYRNRKALRCPSDSSAAPVPNLLTEHVPPRSEDVGLRLSASAQVRAVDLASDGKPDLVVLKSGGDFTLLLGEEPATRGGPLSFTALERPGAGEASGLAVADFDGDFGLDVASVTATGEVELHLSENPEVPQVSSFEIAPPGPGEDDSKVDGSTVRLVVVGHVTESFSGYSLALSYDKSRLTYRGFKKPDTDIQDFSRCPDEKLQGCPGNASARVTLKRVVEVDPREPKDEHLGTFLFDKNAVTSPVTTAIRLESFSANNATFSNTLHVTDGGAEVDVAVEIAGLPLEISLTPPPPALLEMHCSVAGRGVDLAKRPCPDCTVVHVSWSSPAGLLFSTLEVRAGGETPVPICPSPSGDCPSAFDFVTHLSSQIPVTLTGATDDGKNASASCEGVIGVHRPAFTACEKASDKEIRLAWDPLPDVDHYTVFRNSRVLATLEASATEIIDTIPENPPATFTYEIAGEISGTRGPRGTCVVELTEDPDPVTTAPPRIVSSKLNPRLRPSDPNTLSLQWENGEKYDDEDGIELSLLIQGDRRVVLPPQKLSGTLTEFTFEGDLPHGGVTPQDYVFSLRAKRNQKFSTAAESPKIKVPLPGLAVTLACLRDSSGNVLVTWQDVWQGYDGLKLTIDGPLKQEALLDVQSTRFLARGIDSAGTFKFRLEALYDLTSLPLPPGGQPKLAVDCGDLGSSTQVRVGRIETGGQVETGIGLSGIEIPVEASLFGVVNNLDFELEYPEFLQIDQKTGLRVSDPSAHAVITPGQPSSHPGMKKALVQVTGAQIDPNSDGDGLDGRTTLATIVGSLKPGDFSTAGEWPLTFAGTTLLNGQAVSGKDLEDGALVVRRRFVYLNRAEVSADPTKVVGIVVKATFDSPLRPSQENCTNGIDDDGDTLVDCGDPDCYCLNAYQIHLTWDPSLLELQEVTLDDQKETAGFGKGSFFLPSDTSFDMFRTTGHIRVPWLGFDLSKGGKPGFLLPGTDLNLLFLRFRPILPATMPTTFAPVRFVLASPEDCQDGEDNDGDKFVDLKDVDCRPTEDCDNKADDDGDKLVDGDDPDCPVLVTSLLPVRNPGLNVKSLETGIHGGVQITSSVARPFSVRAVSPARGSLLGGHMAVLSGSGFLLEGRKAQDFSIRLLPSSGGAPIPVTGPLVVEARRIGFRVPQAPELSNNLSSLLVDLEVTAGGLPVKLEKGYIFERPKLTSSSLGVGCEGGGQRMVLRGAGLAFSKDSPDLTKVLFDVMDGSPPRRAELDLSYAAELESERWDGTWLPIRTPDLTGHEEAEIQVIVGKEMAVLPALFHLLPDTANCPQLSISPESGSSCGGEEVVIKGRGFKSLPLSKVRFGAVDASPLTPVEDTMLRVKTPKVPERTGTVTVLLLGGQGQELGRIAEGFTFIDYLRGDVNGDNQVNLSDPIFILRYLFQGGEHPKNLDTADTDNNERVDLNDAKVLLNFLFLEGAPPPAICE